MSKRNLFLLFLIAATVVVLTGIPINPNNSDSNGNTDPNPSGLIVGRNINMVSGQQLPKGDPYLQRQNESSIAVSTRNPMHLLAGANDYRTIDIDFEEEKVPGKVPEIEMGNTPYDRDAWLGVFKSNDGGRTWISNLLPGCDYHDTTPDGYPPSPLIGFQAAADPVVRAGPNGLFYYAGIAFNRDTEEGVVFVARFIDNNNNEKDDTIKYLGTKIIARGTGTVFYDKPWIAVDKPRVPSWKVTVDGQRIPRHNVYIAFSAFTGEGKKLRSKILFSRSINCGKGWSHPINISKGHHPHQGATIAVKPKSGAVFVAWRKFGDFDRRNHIIYIARSTTRGQWFHKPVKVASFYSFDQPTTDYSLRTNSYPTMAVDHKDRLYLAWSKRMGGPEAKARIVITTSKSGNKWTTPTPVDNTGLGHQFMPSLTFAAGKLMLMWYDQRNDIAQQAEVPNYPAFNQWIEDSVYRHTIDVRVAQADPIDARKRKGKGKRGNKSNPVFYPSKQASRYLYTYEEENGIPITDEDGYLILKQLQFNPPNYPLFQDGGVPFHGDYIDIAPSPMFLPPDPFDRHGRWTFNLDSSQAWVFHTSWTDNRDVRPPINPDTGQPDWWGNWVKYNPPRSFQDNFPSPGCGDALTTGMRNQNIYTASISQGFIVGSPGNSKPLGTLGEDSNGNPIPRAFPVTVKSTTGDLKSFILTINAPQGVDASFVQYFDVSEEEYPVLDLVVDVAPYSTIARPVFVYSPDPKDSVKVDVTDLDTSLTNIIVLNPDPTSPEIENPEDYEGPNIKGYEVHDPNIKGMSIINLGDAEGSLILNPNIKGLDVINSDSMNPNIKGDPLSPNIKGSGAQAPNIKGGSVSDTIWEVENNGNTTTTYKAGVNVDYDPDNSYIQPEEAIEFQLLVYRIYTTPAAEGCDLGDVEHHEVVVNIPSPNIKGPNIKGTSIQDGSVENATFTLKPGERAKIVLRASDPIVGNGDDYDPGTPEDPNAQATIISHSTNTKDVQEGIMIPPGDSSALTIANKSFPDGEVGVEYSVGLKAYGGSKDYTNWAVLDGETDGDLPDGLDIYPDSGIWRIYGEPSTPGVFNFTLQVTDSLGQTATQNFSITIFPISGGYTISGTVTIDSSGLEGVVMNGLPDNPITKASGYYSGVVESIFSGTVTPFKQGFTFNPASTEYIDVTENKTQNYTVVTTPTYIISGKVTSGGPGLEDVDMGGLPGNPKTDINGNYSGTVGLGWSGTVTPEKAGYSFNPVSRDYSDVHQGYTNQNYTAIAPEIWRSSESMTFIAAEGGANPSSQTLEVKNSGGGILSYTITDDADLSGFDWLTVSPGSGTSTGDPANTHTVSVDTSGLSAASSPYTATITIADSGASNTPQEVSVALYIGPIIHDETNLWHWFGGDNRQPTFFPRNVGVGQSFIVPNGFSTNSVGFKFSGYFDYDVNPDGHGHAVTLVLNVRLSDGTIIQTVTKNLSAAFAGGWVDFNIGQLNPGEYIFTCYSMDAETNHLSISVCGYTDSTKLPNSDGYRANAYPHIPGMDDIEDWAIWGVHPSRADFNFRMAGTGLVAHYSFNGDANDASGNGNHGTVYGAILTQDRFNNLNSAYAFDGIDDYIEIPDSASFNSNYPITISAWIYLDDNSKGGIVGQWGYGGEGGDAFILYIRDTKLSTNLPREGQSHYELQSNNGLATNQWYHVSMVSTGNLVTLYINGNEDKSVAITVEQVDSYQTVEIGLEDRISGGLNYLDGIIDEIRIYNRALSGFEIQALYSAQTGCIANAPGGGAWTNIGLGSQQEQSFLTNSSQIFNVDVDIVTKNPNGDKTIIMKILSLEGDVLAQIAKYVSYGFNGWLGFDIPGGLSVTSGTTLRIHIEEATGPNTFGWKYNTDTYPNGIRYLYGLPEVNYDWYFRVNCR